MESIWDYLNPLDTDELARDFRAAQPFPYFAIDGLLQAEFLAQLTGAYPSYEEAQQIGREFGAANERIKVQVTDSERFPPAIRTLERVLASQEFRDALSEITGIPNLLADPQLVGGGMHMMGAGGRLDVHVDFNRLEDRDLYRRLNILVFLNDSWGEDWGGFLDLWDPEVKECADSFAPVANRCVVFETSERSYHGVTPLSCPRGITRNSFAAYYYTKEAPEGVAATHSTIFRPRPEEWRRWIFKVSAERLGRSSWALLRRLKRGLLGPRP